MKTLAPEAGMTTLRKEMDRLFDRFWDGDETPTMGAWNPRVELSENRDVLKLKAELPGIDPKDVQVMVENGILTLQGEKRQEAEVKDERFYRAERSYGTFARSLRLPANVDAQRVTATFKNGVLVVELPKTSEAKGTTVPIKVA